MPDKQQRARASKKEAGRLIDAIEAQIAGEMDVQTFGFPLDHELSQLNYHFLSLGNYQGLQKAGCTRFDHYKYIADHLFPSHEWHPWRERQIRSLLDYKATAWTGCAASGKTFTAAEYAVIWWLCDPWNSTVVLTTTTKEMLRKRVWSYIQAMYSELPEKPGNMVDSRMTWCSREADFKHAIFGLAVKDGNTANACAMIQGIHAKRVLLIIDEATATPEGIFEATANMAANEQFQMLVIGNPQSQTGDPHGRFCEPKDGWNSVTLEDDEWETVMQITGDHGICVRFDGDKSPNMAYDKVTKFPYLVTSKQMENARQRLGANSPLYWKFYKGFWPPSGLTLNVWDIGLVNKMDAKHGHLFTGARKTVIGACDPAFGGGDRAIIRFAEVGEVQEKGFLGIELRAVESLELDMAQAEDYPIHYQLADQIIAWAKKEGCEPQNFGLDATGEGGGLYDILRKTWSKRVIGVEFGGAPSDRNVSAADDRACKDVYDRRVTELWFQSKEFLESGQLRGLDTPTIDEFCNREYEVKKNKIRLETKDEMKARYTRSPDMADTVAVLTEVARQIGVMPSTAAHVNDTNKEWDEQVEQAGDIYDLNGLEDPDYEMAI